MRVYSGPEWGIIISRIETIIAVLAEGARMLGCFYYGSPARRQAEAAQSGARAHLSFFARRMCNRSGSNVRAPLLAQAPRSIARDIHRASWARVEVASRRFPKKTTKSPSSVAEGEEEMTAAGRRKDGKRRDATSTLAFRVLEAFSLATAKSLQNTEMRPGSRWPPPVVGHVFLPHHPFCVAHDGLSWRARIKAWPATLLGSLATQKGWPPPSKSGAPPKKSGAEVVD